MDDDEEEQGQKSEKKGFSLFKKKEEAPKGPQVSDVLDQINTLDRRLRMLESRNTDLNRKVQVGDKNILNERKKFNNEFKAMNSDILELKREINSIKNKLDLIINELKGCARKEELDVLKRYIDLWEPVNFVTKNEVEKIIQEKLDELNRQ